LLWKNPKSPGENPWQMGKAQIHQNG